MVIQLNLGNFASWRDDASTPSAQPLVIDVREPWELQTAAVKEDGFKFLHVPMQSIPANVDT